MSIGHQTLTAFALMALKMRKVAIQSLSIPSSSIQTTRKSNPTGLLLLFYILTQCVSLMQTQSSFAQTAAELEPRWGVFGQYSRNQHVADFIGLPGFISTSPGYKEGQGSGWSAGMLYEVPFNERLSASLRFGYAVQSAVLRQTRDVSLVDAKGMQIQGGFIDYSIDARLASIGAEVLFGWKPFRFPFSGLNGLTLMAGGRAGWLVTNRFSQSERLVEPTGTVRFPDGTTSQNVYTNEAIPNITQLQIALIGGIGYDIPITLSETETLVVTPEALYAYGITPIAKNMSWNVHSIRAGLSVKFISTPERSMSLPASVRTAATSTLNTQIQAFATDTEAPVSLLRVEEFATKQMIPLLHYVFFDQNSAALPKRYARLLPSEAASFNERGLNILNSSDALETYYHVLNIIGRRLQQSASSTLTLVGCHDATSSAFAETPDSTLARRRAETIQEYLRTVWNIASERIKIRTRDLPERRSTAPDQLSRVEENRRVEFVSNDAAILKPIVLEDTMRVTTPSSLTFRFNTVAQAGLAKWAFKANQGGRSLKRVAALGAPDSVLVWNLNTDQSSIPRTEGALGYTLDVLDNGEQPSQATGSVPVELVSVQKKRRRSGNDREVGIYRILTLERELPDLSRDNLRLIDEYVKPTMTAESMVTVVGYTDMLGMFKANQQIAEKRAQEAAKRLAGVITKITATGIGSTIQLYPNTTPEGRFYSRSLEIRVETPVW